MLLIQSKQTFKANGFQIALQLLEDLYKGKHFRGLTVVSEISWRTTTTITEAHLNIDFAQECLDKEKQNRQEKDRLLKVIMWVCRSK